MTKYECQKDIEITKHAMQRLEERVITHAGFKSWKQMVKTARYKGRSEYDMSDAEYQWCSTHITGLHNSSQVRILSYHRPPCLRILYQFSGNMSIKNGTN